MRVMRSCRHILHTGAGVNILRTDVLRANWMAYANGLTTLPRIRDANNNRLVTKFAIHLYVDTGGVRLFDRFLVSDNLSVPCILGTEFIEQIVEAILPRLRKIVWQEHVRCTEELPRPAPILACFNDSAWDSHWQDKPARVRACKQERVDGEQEEWIMGTCDTPGMDTITLNARLCRHEPMAAARGLAIVKPDMSFLVKVCNFGKEPVNVRKKSTLGFPEPYQGPMLAAVLDDNNPKDGTDSSSDDASRDPLEDFDLSEAPMALHKQIRDMLKTHSSMWDGTLGVIRATQHAIVTPRDALPIRSQPYRTGPFKRQIIADQINQTLKLNVIAPGHSAWASPVVVVPKKNGKARFCVDYRQLNKITKKDAHPLLRMTDCLDSLGDAQVFTSLDCTAGYWQMPLRKQDQEKTAFTTHCGIYHWLSMPLGLKNAPATFSARLGYYPSDVCERPPIPHPKSFWDERSCPRPVKSHHTFVQHSRFFPALVTSAENSRHLIWPAPFLLLWRAHSHCSPRTAPIRSFCSAASAARARLLLSCDTTPLILSTRHSNFVHCVHGVDVTTRPTVFLFMPTDSNRR